MIVDCLYRHQNPRLTIWDEGGAGSCAGYVVNASGPNVVTLKRISNAILLHVEY